MYFKLTKFNNFKITLYRPKIRIQEYKIPKNLFHF